MLLNVLFVLAIIWLTFAIASIVFSMYYCYVWLFPLMDVFVEEMDSVENVDQSQLNNDDIPEWDIGDDVAELHDIPF